MNPLLSTLFVTYTNYDINFGAFMIIGPIVIIALFIYLHIFVGQHRLSILSQESKLPTLFNIDSKSAKIATWILFYWLTPITIATFSWKAFPRDDLWYALKILTDIVTGLSIFIQLRRIPRRLSYIVIMLILLYPLFSMYISSAMPFYRHINLFKADLRNRDMHNINLNGAYASKSNLEGANLNFASLSNASFEGANLADASLMLADLRDAVLMDANLKGANLEATNLFGAFLMNANLTSANIKGAHLANSKLLSANLAGADLKEADLSNVDGLNCRMLQLATNWQDAYRDAELACGSKIPSKPKFITPVIKY